jgi:hypothetical protein
MTWDRGEKVFIIFKALQTERSECYGLKGVKRDRRDVDRKD